MEDLIKALNIFLKYGNPTYPTHCEHDVLTIMEVSPSEVSDDDKTELKRLGFIIDDTDDCFLSYRYGSA